MQKQALYIKLIASLILIYIGLYHLTHINLFEYRIVENKISNWTFSLITVRILIYLEFLLAIFLILPINLKKLTTLLSSLLFSAYSIDITFSYFNNLEISATNPLIISKYLIIQIAILLTLIFIIFLSIKSESKDLKFKWVKIVFPILLFILNFSISPIYIDDYIISKSSIKNSKKDWSILEKYTDSHIKQTSTLIAFFSSNCIYCNVMAKKIGINNRINDSNLNMLIVMPSTETDALNFMKRNKCNTQYIRVSKKDFLSLAGNKFPVIYLVKNNIGTNRWNAKTFNLRLFDQI